MIEITTLSNKKELIEDIAKLAHQEWFADRDIPLGVVIREYKKRSDIRDLPVCFTASHKSTPVGFITLKKTELPGWNSLGPWLSALYVIKEYRNIGIGDRLLHDASVYASRLNFKRLYLFLDHKNLDCLRKYYTKRGWIYLDKTVDTDGNRTEIYFLEL